MSYDAGVLIAEVTEGGNQLTLRAVAAGEAVVVVTATDPWDAETSQSMTVTVRTNTAPEAAQPLPPRDHAGRHHDRAPGADAVFP